MVMPGWANIKYVYLLKPLKLDNALKVMIKEPVFVFTYYQAKCNIIEKVHISPSFSVFVQTSNDFFPYNPTRLMFCRPTIGSYECKMLQHRNIEKTRKVLTVNSIWYHPP